jgi:dTDP-4-amino-4,6-dideoxygalactose transaminase
MAEIVRAHGLALHPVDIEFSEMLPRIETVEAALREGARVFVLAHLFGTRAKVDQFAALCRKYRVLFVEDCAQAFDGRLVASAADISLYSFGPIKAATALGGAIAIFRDRELACAVDKVTQTYQPFPDRWFRRRIVKYLFLKAVSYPVPCAAVLWSIRVLGKDPDAAITGLAKNFYGGDLLTQLRRRPPPRLEWLLDRRLREAKPRQAHCERGRRITAAVAAVAPSPGANAAAHAWWLTPLLVEDPAAVMAELRAAGFDASRGATSLCAVRAPGHSTPNADYLLRKILYLPNSSHLTNGDLERLIECLRASIKRSGHQIAMVARAPVHAPENELAP